MSVDTSAAEHMDGIYRYQRYFYDLTRRYYLLGRDRLIAGLDVPEGGTVLEVGCGTARNLIKAARRYPSMRGYGLDVSEEMLRTARKSVERAGFAGQMSLAAADATQFDAAALWGVPVFQRIFISYALSMIPPWREVVACAASHLAPGGSLHVVDFGDFAGYPGWAVALQRAWLRRFSVVPIAGMETELIALAAQHNLEASITRLYGGYAIVARLTRY